MSASLSTLQADQAAAVQGQAARLLAMVAEPLLRGLGGSPSWLWIADPKENCFRCARAWDIDMESVPELPLAAVTEEWAQQPVAVSGLGGQRLASLVDIFPEELRRLLTQSQCLALPMRADQQLLALFFAVFQPPNQIDSSRTEQVGQTLARIGQGLRTPPAPVVPFRQ